MARIRWISFFIFSCMPFFDFVSIFVAIWFTIYGSIWDRGPSPVSMSRFFYHMLGPSRSHLSLHPSFSATLFKFEREGEERERERDSEQERDRWRERNKERAWEGRGRERDHLYGLLPPIIVGDFLFIESNLF